MVKYIRQGWLVLLLAMAFGGSLAGVHIGLMDRIESNKKLEILKRVPQLVLGYDEVESKKIVPIPAKELVEVAAGDNTAGYEVSKPKELDLSGSGKYIVYKIRTAAGRKTVGYVVRIKGQGFADAIELLVGIRHDGKLIKGVYILDQKETPGLGDKITQRTFSRQFDDQPKGLMTVVKDPSVRNQKNEDKDNRIDAISGATVSSRSVCEIINSAIVAVSTDWAAGNVKGFVFGSEKEKE